MAELKDFLPIANVGGLVLIAFFFWFLLRGVREDTSKMQDFIQRHMTNDQEHLSQLTAALTEVVSSLRGLAERVEAANQESRARNQDHERLASERQQAIIHTVERETRRGGGA